MEINQVLFNWAVAIAGFLGGFWVKVIWDSMKELRADMRKIERDLPEIYVRKDDFKDAVKEIKEDMKEGFKNIDNTLNLIFKKLEGKTDK